DFMRFYFCSVSRGEDLLFDWDAFNDIRKFFNVFWNSYNFINLYMDLNAKKAEKISLKGLKAEDKWIVSKFNSTAKEALNGYNKYMYQKAVSAMNEFVLEEFSRTYIKLVRDRVKEKAVSNTMNYVMINLLKLLAPVTPHITEYIYQDLREKGMKESIHLHELPSPDKKLINEGLEKEFALVKELSQFVLSMREEKKLRKRWALKELVIEAKKPSIKETKEILSSMVNVKKVLVKKESPKGNYFTKEFNEEIKLHLNVDIDSELKEEWELSELVRRIQGNRKELMFNPNEKIKLFIDCSEEKFLKKYKKEIEKETNTIMHSKKGEKKKLLNMEFYFELKK
ncbi:class I tRNA ligase family protein, partial [Candidatus Micrarchaeota archaeon]|nr:class I tRNA ligase family protein [Candidatus Micrarchaeota archaeon]